MAFFDDLKQKVMSGSKQVADKAKEMADITKLRGQIASEKSKIKEAYAVLGELYYNSHSQDPESEDFAAQVAVISTSKEAIAAFEEEIERIKAESATAAEPASVSEEGVEKNVVETETVENEAAAEEEKAEEKAPEKKFCSNCGASVSTDASFCSTCGTPIQ